MLLAATTFTAMAQKIQMDVMMGDKKIGEIKAEKTAKGKNVQYNMTSDVEASMMVTVTVSSTTKSYWYNSQLTNSRATRTSNMPGQNQVTTLDLQGKEYVVAKNDVVSKAPYPVRVTITTLYFQEPLKDTAAFSEIQGLYLPVTSLGNHRYQISQPNGKKDIYVYENGKLQKIETVIVGKNVEFVVK